MKSSFELLEFLINEGIKADEFHSWWWPNAGSFEVVVGSLLTQQAKWSSVLKCLENLKDSLHVEAIAGMNLEELAQKIKPSGFYNTKAKRLKLLCQNMILEFGTFEEFQKSVTREWLLNQKGIGFESADSILNYGCYKEVFVVDNYTARFVKKFGYEFESYEALQEWMIDGMGDILSLYDKSFSRAQIYARFHGKIVEYMKRELTPAKN